MNPIDNPFNPGAGSPPPELAGRDKILELASVVIARAKKGKAVKSVLMLGKRGVGKTVLLNRIDQMAEIQNCQTAIFEADPGHTLPQLLTEQLYRILLKLDRHKRISGDIQNIFSMLRGFASVFKVKYGEFEVGLTNEGTTGDLTIDLADLFVSIGTAAKKRKSVVVIIIDEVQYIDQKGLGALIMALHKISQRQLPVLFFGAGLPQLAKLAGNAKSYAERLFEYPEVDRLDIKSAQKAITIPLKREKVTIDQDALDYILDETDRYPFFLQVWAYHLWNIAPNSPISKQISIKTTKKVFDELDKGFFKVRFDRLTTRQQNYARAMAEFGSALANSTEVASLLNLTVKQAAPIRDELIKKGMAYSPKRGYVAFTVPKFDEFLKRKYPDMKF